MYTEQNSTSWTFVYLFSIIPYYFFLKKLKNYYHISSHKFLQNFCRRKKRSTINFFLFCFFDLFERLGKLKICFNIHHHHHHIILFNIFFENNLSFRITFFGQCGRIKSE